MAASEITPRERSIDGLGTAAEMPRGGRSLVVPAMIAGAWMTVLVAQATGTAAALHHHALIENGPPLWVALPLFLVAWQVMIVAMMLPASLPAVRSFQAGSLALSRPSFAIAALLGAYGIIWAAVGFLAFMGDFVLHQVVDAWPWLAARPWLIEAGVLALAGSYQFLPLKRRALAACRHPGHLASSASLPELSATQLGVRHALECLGSSWALMLVMFAAGFASLWTMAALTVLMLYEATGRHGPRAATAAGIILLMAALTVLSGPLPGTA
jgi:predicted metal-binding membrane protein